MGGRKRDIGKSLPETHELDLYNIELELQE